MDNLVVVGIASEEATAVGWAPESFDLTYIGTFRNIVVVAVSVEAADQEMEAATAAAGSVAVYSTVYVDSGKITPTSATQVFHDVLNSFVTSFPYTTSRSNTF